ncbi:hypothetical protein CRE_09719 [Caenorhabditis remanei]|uniref:Helicase ATP-binding domain-containing protein n=1 Tax=Caenorhabditis remanei TaxID=31234 RepID=E3N4X9_CAERE|nr:hypothetical protein CRE_09719 [Caenorhabditis remanei]
MRQLFTLPPVAKTALHLLRRLRPIAKLRLFLEVGLPILAHQYNFFDILLNGRRPLYSYFSRILVYFLLFCHQGPKIFIGTPGRIDQLLKLGVMDLSHVDLFVLDEADKLMDDVFRDDINIIINSLPPIRQVAVFSATYPQNLDNSLSTFLRDAALVRFNADDVQLIGIKQYVLTKCSPMLEKFHMC